MPTTTELLATRNPQIGIVVLFDGIDVGFCDHRDLVGIDTGADHAVRLGLQREGLSLQLGVNLRDGKWRDSPASITILDLQGDLAELFLPRAATERSLGDVPIGGGLPVHPSTSLAARTDLHDLYIGLERIGPAGERHQYAVPPGFDIGMEHTITTPALDIDGAPVTDSPIVWIGRRAAVYLCVRDHVTYPDRNAGPTSWRPFSEARRLWCGTIQGPGDITGREWRFDLEGPGSLLRKALGASFGSNPVRVTGSVSLVTTEGERTDGMLVRLTTGLESFGVREWVASVTGTTRDEWCDSVIAEINTTRAATGTDGVWEEQAGYSVSMDTDATIRISVDSGITGPSSVAIGLHRTVWAALGYAVEEQASLYPDWEDNRAVDFVGPLDQDLYGCPGPDYWIGFFYASDDLNTSASDGSTKTYRPKYLGGVTVLDATLDSGRGQVIRLADAAIGGDGSSVSHPGQLAWPVASLPGDAASPIQIDGVDCDRCGLWVFSGKRRYAGSEDVFDEHWIGLASWTNGSAQEDGLVARNSIIVTRWLNPALFGYEAKLGGSDSHWVARDESSPEEGQISAAPLFWLGYQLEADKAHVVLQRLLHSTGTSSGWTSYEQDTPDLTAGDNEPVGTHVVPRDAEIADLGLAIPADWIASPEDFDAEAERVENGAVLDVKVAGTGGYQAEDAIASLMQSVGWVWHFRGGQFGVWCPADPLTLADVEVVLTPTQRVETYRQAGGVRLVQDMHKWSPVDLWKVAANWQPLERRVASSTELRAPDSQFRYRPGETAGQIQAHASRNRGAGLLERIMHLSRWFALPHFEVRSYPVDAIVGLDLWPGTVVRLTDPELLDPVDGYGITNRIAIVTSTTRTFGESEFDMACDLLVLATRTATPRLNAPMAQGWGYNSANGRLYVSDDWAEIGNGWADAASFVEPSYSGIAAIGGNAVVEVWQWDGSTWAQTFAGTVTGAVTTAGAAYLTLTSTSGTYYRDRDSWVVLRPSTVANAAWVAAIFSPVATDAGTWTDSAAASQAVYPWED